MGGLYRVNLILAGRETQLECKFAYNVGYNYPEATILFHTWLIWDHSNGLRYCL